MDHDRFRLDIPELYSVDCPRCDREMIDPEHAYLCDLCEGAGEVNPVLEAWYKSELKN